MEDVASRRGFWARWIPVGVYAGLIFLGSSLPARAYPVSGLWDYDKLLHAAVYAGLGALVGRASGRFWLAILACAAYGISDELHQAFTPGRDASVGDALADVVGAFSGVAIYATVASRRLRNGYRP